MFGRALSRRFPIWKMQHFQNARGDKSASVISVPSYLVEYRSNFLLPSFSLDSSYRGFAEKRKQQRRAKKQVDTAKEEIKKATRQALWERSLLPKEPDYIFLKRIYNEPVEMKCPSITHTEIKSLVDKNANIVLIDLRDEIVGEPPIPGSIRIPIPRIDRQLSEQEKKEKNRQKGTWRRRQFLSKRDQHRIKNLPRQIWNSKVYNKFRNRLYFKHQQTERICSISCNFDGIFKCKMSCWWS